MSGIQVLVESFLTQVQQEIRMIEQHVEFAGVVGSRLIDPYKEGSDLDILIVFRHPTRSDSVNLKAYLALAKSMQNIRRRLSASATLLVYPTFRLSGIFKKFSKRRSSLLVHLLVYPSLEHLLRTEQPEIVNSFSRNLRVLYGPRDYRAKLRLRSRPLCKRLEYYHSLFSDVFQLVNLCGLEEFDSDFVVIESIDKICYLTRYLCGELIYATLGRTVDRWDEIYEMSGKIVSRPELLHEVNELVQKPSTAGLSIGRLRRMLESVASLLNQLYQYA